MHKGRMEAFSDGVIAIIITIMVLELKVQHGSHLQDLKPLIPVFISYVLSFIYVGIYWNNHHHLLMIVKTINGKVLWANLHLLFWLSVVPFTTAWMGENNFDLWPTILYGFVLFMNGIAFSILSKALQQHEGSNSALAKAVKGSKKEYISEVMYALAIGMAFINTTISFIMYVLVASIWFIPDRRVEKRINKD